MTVISGISEKYACLVDGEPAVTRLGMALLCGISEEEAQAEYERQGQPERLRVPQHWLRQGRSITARYGHDGLLEALRRLAAEHEAGMR